MNLLRAKLAFTSGTLFMGTPRTFKQYGKSGMWMSDAIPNFHEHADDFCVIKSMRTDHLTMHRPSWSIRISAARSSFVWCLDNLRLDPKIRTCQDMLY